MEVFRRPETGFNEQIQAALRKGTPIPLFVDEFRSPLAATVMARALWEMLEKGLRGLYHLCGSQRLSRHAIGVLLNDRWGHDPSLIQATSPGFLPRPTPGAGHHTGLFQASVHALVSIA